MWQTEMKDNAQQFCELLTLQEEVHVMSMSHVEVHGYILDIDNRSLMNRQSKNYISLVR